MDAKITLDDAAQAILHLWDVFDAEVGIEEWIKELDEIENPHLAEALKKAYENQ